MESPHCSCELTRSLGAAGGGGSWSTTATPSRSGTTTPSRTSGPCSRRWNQTAGPPPAAPTWCPQPPALKHTHTRPPLRSPPTARLPCGTLKLFRFLLFWTVVTHGPCWGLHRERDTLRRFTLKHTHPRTPPPSALRPTPLWNSTPYVACWWHASPLPSSSIVFGAGWPGGVLPRHCVRPDTGGRPCPAARHGRRCAAHPPALSSTFLSITPSLLVPPAP